MLISIAFTDEELKTIWTSLNVGSIHLVGNEKMVTHMLELAKKFEIVGLLRKEG